MGDQKIHISSSCLMLTIIVLHLEFTVVTDKHVLNDGNHTALTTFMFHTPHAILLLLPNSRGQQPT